MKCDISTAQSTIIQRNKPVILTDTCALIDIVRVPHRSNIRISHLEGAKEIVKKAANMELSIVLTSTVETEFNIHLAPACIELERYITKLVLENSSLINVIESLGLSYKFSIDGLAGLKVSEKLQNIAQEFHDNALVLQRDDECDRKAHDRVELYQAPATRGKSESKDCLIIEHYLKLVNGLRETSFSKNIVFVTSNVTDFGKPQTPKSPLDTQFISGDIKYCNNFRWALQEAES
jgi:hypothetical protein